MPKKLTTAEWILKAQATHGTRYDYSEVEYVNAKTKVRVGCPIHGIWECDPSNHVSNGRGCPKCGGSAPKTTDDFIVDANKVHSSAYDYSKSKYVNAHTPLTIICPLHGDFIQSPTAHLGGQGCPICGNEQRLQRGRNLSLELVEKRINGDSNGLVSIDRDTFTNINSEADFVCENHGRFRRLVNSALYRGNPCLECYYESDEYKENALAPKYTQASAEEKINILIEEGVTYGSFVYKGAETTEISLYCPEHGEWMTTFYGLTRTKGKCPECARIAAIAKRTSSIRERNELLVGERFEAYLDRFREYHGERYDYTKAAFENGKTPICIICPIHGEFWQPPDTHAISGCKKCANEELAGLYNERFFELRADLKMVPALVYCLELTWVNGHCFKFGITRNTLRQRFGMALAKGISIKVLAVYETTLYDAWQSEVKLIEASANARYKTEDKAFTRAARISPTELFSNLPTDWRDLINWTQSAPYVLR